jgi:hypothetical protein
MEKDSIREKKAELKKKKKDVKELDLLQHIAGKQSNVLTVGKDLIE